jgi:two-component system chemotaxis response regulator CheY
MAKVLIVDDSLFMRRILRGIVEGAGHVVIGEAGDGNEAMERYVELQPHLVIMDITMPNVDGLEGLRRIRIIDHDAKVIMCSAMGQQSFIKEALDMGALDFIVKPFRKDKVIQTINRALEYHPRYNL